MQTNADLVLAFETLEAIGSTYYATKEKTNFAINNYSQAPIYSNILNIPYPNLDEITCRLDQFTKEIQIFNASQLGKEKFGNMMFGNTLLV